jgi:PAP2 superfamily
MDIVTRAAAAAAGLRRDILRAARRDRSLYAIALTVFVSGFAMQPFTGQHPDWETTGRVFVRLGIVGTMAVFVLVTWRLGWLAVVARSRTPTRDMLDWVRRFFAGPGLAANAASTVAIFCLYAGGFSVLKGAIAVVSPFAWDTALVDLDRAMHFGRLPHEWLEPLTEPLPLAVLNVTYNLWFFLLVVGWLGAAVAVRRPGLRHQYLMAFMLTWFVGGFLVACGFSSAGPCYYARIGLGDLYAPLMAKLHAAEAEYGIWAVNTQNVLWDGFTGERRGSAGISAFPSMHVASATLFMLAMRHLGRLAFAAAVVFWAMILAGSILLAWHYAVDGYAATLIAILVWRFAGRYGRVTGVESPQPAPA